MVQLRCDLLTLIMIELKRVSHRPTKMASACIWCGSPSHKIYRSGFCRQCYEIQSEQRRLAKRVSRYLKAGTPWKCLDLRLRIDCHVAGAMGEMAKAEGELFAHHRRPEISGQTIEDLLTYISHSLLPRKDPLVNCYYNCATTITRLFSPEQRKVLIDLLSEAVNQHKRHLRRTRAKAGNGKLVQDSKHPPKWLRNFLSKSK